MLLLDPGFPPRHAVSPPDKLAMAVAQAAIDTIPRADHGNQILVVDG